MNWSVIFLYGLFFFYVIPFRMKESALIAGKFDRKVVPDASTFLYDALAFKVFDSSDIYIPFSVLEEIDTFKRDMGEKEREKRPTI